MDRRLMFHSILVALLGSENVYFQPPSSTEMRYPCIRYQRDSARTDHADNVPWRRTKRYEVTVITRDPDSDIPEKVSQLPTSTFSRHFTSDNLNHDVYNVSF